MALTNDCKPGGFKTTEIWHLTVLRARSPKSSCWYSWFLLKALRKNLLHALLSQLLVTASDP